MTDLYYLDHYGRSAHFPGHAVVLAGYDETVAYLSDTAFDELQTTTLESLAQARHSEHPVYPLSGHMFTLRDSLDAEAIAAAAPRAIERAAGRMISPPLGDFEGLPALRRFAAEVGEWPQAVEDWQWCARFNYQVIERRGTGGGNFRLMYSRFLGEVGSPQAPVAAEAAERWSGPWPRALHEASRGGRARGRACGRRSRTARRRCCETEERLWPALAA